MNTLDRTDLRMLAVLQSEGRITNAELAERVNAWDEVVACHALTGAMDYLLHVYVADLADFSRFLLDHLLNASGVADVNSSFVLRTVKRSPSLPLAHLGGQ
jgi:Lrp/AsnC family leucine-responsive transcriptional regulator